MNKIKNHNFGYGCKKINKLNLNTVEEVKEYLSDILDINANFSYKKIDDKTYKVEKDNTTIQILEA